MEYLEYWNRVQPDLHYQILPRLRETRPARGATPPRAPAAHDLQLEAVRVQEVVRRDRGGLLALELPEAREVLERARLRNARGVLQRQLRRLPPRPMPAGKGRRSNKSWRVVLSLDVCWYRKHANFGSAATRRCL